MQKRDVIAKVGMILADLGIATKQNVSFEWMTNRSPMESEHAAPPRVRYRLMAIHARLGGDLSILEQKRRALLPFDFEVEGKILIEVERKEHFSSYRMSTLEFYDGLDHDLDVVSYRKLCSNFADSADRSSATQDAPDFRFPGGRSAQRAFFDAAKDLLVPANGHRLIRLPAADEELVENIGLRLRVLL